MKMNMVLSGVTLAAMIAAGVSTVAFAQSGEQRGPGMGQVFNFEDMDADKDGKVTKEEMSALRATRVAELDADKDGKVSAAELTAMHMKGAEARATERANQMIERMDADGDGLLSGAEMAVPVDRGGRLFDRIDADGDGAISQAEADAIKERMAGRRGDHGGKHRFHRGGN